MAKLDITLDGRVAMIDNEFPIVLSTERDLEFHIVNYIPEHKYILQLGWLQFPFTYDTLKLDMRYLDNDFDRVFILDNYTEYDLNVDRLKAKRVINIASEDKLNDLLVILYQKNKELERRLNKLEEEINSGDLLI